MAKAEETHPNEESKLQVAKSRRSDRINIELPLQVSGDDTNGLAFVESTRTAIVSRHGAKIHSRHKMARDQELVIRCLPTAKEGVARIIGELGEAPEGYAYGIGFLDPEVNIWGIEFPSSPQSEQAEGGTLLECSRCHNRILFYLDAMEEAVLETGRGLSRLCDRCADVNIWNLVPQSQAGEQMAAPARPLIKPDIPHPKPASTQDKRKHKRIRARMTACIRHPDLGEEVVTTEDMSRGGFCFRSAKYYEIGSQVGVALPYAQGGANIFVAARIAHADELRGQNLFLYGLAYTPLHKGWPRK